MTGCKPPSKFQLENEDKLNAVLGEDKGSGWEAHFVRNIEVHIYSETSPLFISTYTILIQFDVVYFFQKDNRGNYSLQLR